MVIRARSYSEIYGLVALYYSFVHPNPMYWNHSGGITYKLIWGVSLVFKAEWYALFHMSNTRNKSLYKALNIMKFKNIDIDLIGKFMYHHR